MKKFRDSASFGKRIEFSILAMMLKQGLDIYIPLVDDIGIDAIIRKQDNQIAEVQIKARSKEVKEGNAAFFAGIFHECRDNYWFIFYSERLDTMWILSSKEFIEKTRENKTGKNKGKRNIKFNGCKKNKQTGKKKEYALEKFRKYIAKDFSKIDQN